MARSVEPLVVGKVIGDVVDPFTPTAELIVQYGPKQISKGCDMKPSLATQKPHVKVVGPDVTSSNLYTLVMVDPDAPSPSEPKFREWLHWMVVDIPGGGDATQGKEIVEYIGPKPPTGIHRYVFVLFNQSESNWKSVPPADARSYFNTRQFAYENNLGSPVASVYFHSQKEVASRKR